MTPKELYEWAEKKGYQDYQMVDMSHHTVIACAAPKETGVLTQNGPIIMLYDGVVSLIDDKFIFISDDMLLKPEN